MCSTPRALCRFSMAVGIIFPWQVQHRFQIFFIPYICWQWIFWTFFLENVFTGYKILRHMYSLPFLCFYCLLDCTAYLLRINLLSFYVCASVYNISFISGCLQDCFLCLAFRNVILEWLAMVFFMFIHLVLVTLLGSVHSHFASNLKIFSQCSSSFLFCFLFL